MAAGTISWENYGFGSLEAAFVIPTVPGKAVPSHNFVPVLCGPSVFSDCS